MPRRPAGLQKAGAPLAMAIYHLSAKVISRGKGQSAIAAAAYRSGEQLRDEQANEQKFYKARADRIMFTEVMAPKDAPAWAQDRNALWNHAERAEKRKDAQLAREIEVSLPHELTEQQRAWLVKDFAREAFVRKGYAVDIAIHAPDKRSDERNHHAHILVTMRTLGPDGFAAKKDRSLNTSEQLGEWRERWANLANRHLERHGHAARIDHRSLEAQGIEQEPTIHLGYAAKEIDARGGYSERMEVYKAVLARNDIRAEMQAIDRDMAKLEPDPRNADDARHAEQRERLIREAARLAEAERVQVEQHSARRYREQMEREAEEAKKAEQERRRNDTDRDAAGDITDARNRYAQALGATYTIRDPYGSLANAAMAEYGAFHRQQAALKQEAAAEQDPDKRRLIDLRRDIEGHEYMAITSERLARIGRAIAMGDNAGARRDDELAKQYSAMAAEKRQERAELQRELKQRQLDERAATERGGLGSAAQQGAATQQRERSPRYRTTAEVALEKAAGQHAPAVKGNERARQAEASQAAERETAQQREGLKPHETAEGAAPTKEARAMSAAEKALRSAAGDMDKTQHRQRYIRQFSRESSDGRQQRDADGGHARDPTSGGRERTRGE